MKKSLKLFKNTFLTDLERGICSYGFVAGMVLVMVAVLFGCGDTIFLTEEKMKAGLDYHYHLNAILKGITSESMTLVLPLAGTLPFSMAYLDDRKNGYLKAYLPRCGRSCYRISKVLAGAISAGLCTALGFALITCVLTLIFAPMQFAAPLVPAPTAAAGEEAAKTVTEMVAESAFADGLWHQIYIKTGVIFCVGMLWGSVGALFGCTFLNRYMALGGPFLVNYILVILTTRYITGVYTLNPREWLTQASFWEGQDAGVILLIILLAAAVMVAYAIALERRLTA